MLSAIGVSGNTPQEDEAIAQVGADSLSQIIAGAPAPVTYFPAEQVKTAFAKGAPLLEVKGYRCTRVAAPSPARSRSMNTRRT
ncbi:MAG: hypothetical protein ACREX9_23680 [Gammaproteobacteria bacterium]